MSVQLGLFEPAPSPTSPPSTSTALVLFEAPHLRHLGRLLGWGYAGDEVVMYGVRCVLRATTLRKRPNWKFYTGGRRHA